MATISWALASYVLCKMQFSQTNAVVFSNPAAMITDKTADFKAQCKKPLKQNYKSHENSVLPEKCVLVSQVIFHTVSLFDN